MCDDHMDIISVLKDTIDVRDDYKSCHCFTTDDVEDVILGFFYCNVFLMITQSVVDGVVPFA